jgi:hypothetical protein
MLPLNTERTERTSMNWAMSSPFDESVEGSTGPDLDPVSAAWLVKAAERMRSETSGFEAEFNIEPSIIQPTGNARK